MSRFLEQTVHIIIANWVKESAAPPCCLAYVYG